MNDHSVIDCAICSSIVDQQINSGEAKVKVLVSNDRWYGVTYREDKPIVQKAFTELIAADRYPAPLWS